MKKPSSYTSATAFRQALETRLANVARDEAMDIQRLRRQVSNQPIPDPIRAIRG